MRRTESRQQTRAGAAGGGAARGTLTAFRAARRRDGERGLTLIETLVAMAAALVLLAPTVLVTVTAQNHAGGDIQRANTIQSASAGLTLMDRELRQAYALEYPTATNDTSPSCPEGSTGSAAGVQGCNVADVLARIPNTGFSGSDFELRYDCSIPSATIAGDQSCWRYLCSASAATGASSTCTAASSTLLSKRLVIDDLVNGTSADPVFSFCYPASAASSACGTGAARPTSATVTIKVPSTAGRATGNGGDPSVIYLTDGIYFANLDFGQ